MQMTGPIARQLPLLILVSFDGFRHDYLSQSLTPNLHDLSTQGTIGNMESMYITKTFPNHFSMVTGLYEDEHEIINNKMFDPRLNETFKLSVTSKKWWDFKGTNMPIWVANELYGEGNRYSASMMYPGSSTPYRDTLPTHLRNFSKGANYTDNIEAVISWLTDPKRPANFVSMYFDEPDTIAHMHGPWGSETLDSVRKVDSAAGYLVKRLRDVGLADRSNIIFVSDHGMAEVKNIIYFDQIVDTSGFELHGVSPGWSVFIKPEKRHLKNKIFSNLLAISKKNHFRIYKRQDIPPELHYSKSVRVGDFFIISDENYDLYLKKPLKTEQLPVIWGNHGWKPSNRDMRPLFLAYGPSFKKNYKHEDTFPNIDLFPLMTFLLNLPADNLPNNGSLFRVIDVIDINHFEDTNNALRLAYLLLFGAVIMALCGVICTMLASTGKPKYRANVELDDLAPGLNIDLGYYLTDDQFGESKKKLKKKEELIMLLSR